MAYNKKSEFHDTIKYIFEWFTYLIHLLARIILEPYNTYFDEIRKTYSGFLWIPKI